MQDNSAILQEPDWTDLRFVLAAARAGALAGAARQIGVNETTVSRRLARVERRLAVRLFERVGGRLVVTQAGARLVDAAQRMETEVTRAARSVAGAGAGVTGTVRLTSVPVIVNRLLIPAVGPLLAANPSLRIELLADPRDLSLGRREAATWRCAWRVRRATRGLSPGASGASTTPSTAAGTASRRPCPG